MNRDYETKKVDVILNFLEGVQRGDLSERLEISNKKDLFDDIAQGINQVVDTLQADIDELRTKSEVLDVLRNISRLMTKESNIYNVIPLVADMLLKIDTYKAVVFAIYDDEKEAYVPYSYLKNKTIDETWLITTDGTGNGPICIQDTILRNLPENIKTWSQHLQCQDCVYAKHLKNIDSLIIPIKDDALLIGVISLYIESHHGSYDDQVSLISSIADDLGIIYHKSCDLSRIKEYEQSLKITRNNFINIVQKNQDGILITNMNGIIKFVNDAVPGLFNQTRENLIGEEFGVSLVDDKVTEINIIRSDNEVGIGEMTCTNTEWYGEAAKIVTIHDVTEKRTMENALKESEANYRDLWENISDMVQTCAIDGTILYVNKAWKDTMGYHEDEVVNKSIFDFMSSDMKEHCQIIFNNVVKGGAESAIFAKFVKKSGEVIELEGSANCRFEGNTPVSTRAIFHDVTEKNKIQHELMRSNADLEQFAYAASHDLKEPLRVISSYIELIKENSTGSLDSKSLGFMDRVILAADRMQNMIKELLSYSRITTKGEVFARCDLNKALQEVIASLKIAIQEKNAIISIHALPEIEADYAQIVRVFQNLISNSLKYCEEEVAKIEISAMEHEKHWQFCIKDNGIGIEPEYFELVFELFNRLHGRTKYSGTGMGLAIVKKIILRHHGRIWVTSTPGKGSEFCFIIPRGLSNLAK